MDDSSLELDLDLYGGDIIELLEAELCANGWRRRDEAPSEAAFLSLGANGQLERDLEGSELLGMRL